MASDRQIKANRKNAKRSTGPTSEVGKSKTSRNAHYHGLSRPIRHDQCELNALSRFMDRAELNPQGFDLAGIVVAKLELIRVRAARYNLLSALSKAPDSAKKKRLNGLQRYERLAFAKQKRAMRAIG
jgi:hypothetical protein